MDATVSVSLREFQVRDAAFRILSGLLSTADPEGLAECCPDPGAWFQFTAGLKAVRSNLVSKAERCAQLTRGPQDVQRAGDSGQETVAEAAAEAPPAPRVGGKFTRESARAAARARWAKKKDG